MCDLAEHLNGLLLDGELLAQRLGRGLRRTALGLLCAGGRASGATRSAVATRGATVIAETIAVPRSSRAFFPALLHARAPAGPLARASRSWALSRSAAAFAPVATSTRFCRSFASVCRQPEGGEGM